MTLVELQQSFPNATKSTWHRHSNGGGWVENTATVAVTAYVGENAWVYENAWVFDEARVYGNARVYGEAQVFGLPGRMA